MPDSRKLVRDAIRAALADVTSGFNVRWPDIATTYGCAKYGVDRFLIDWNAASRNFAFANYGTWEDVDDSTLREPFMVTAFTTALGSFRNGKFEHFNGEITANVVCWIKISGRVNTTVGMEIDDSESLLDAIEQTIADVFTNAQLDFGDSAIVFDGTYSSQREPILLLNDGWAARVPMQFVFEIDN